jgi:hypothetical protein
MDAIRTGTLLDMQRAAIGIRMHSGWGVFVAVSGDADSLAVIDRRRIVVTDPQAPGGNQPYHHAANLELPESAQYLADQAVVSLRLARRAVAKAIQALKGRGYRTTGAAMLMAAGRPLPALPAILASHPLIHTAEGEFFRQAVTIACERLAVAVTAMRERDLDARAAAAFGRTATRVVHTISQAGGSIGPPWTKDHKAAALAASIVLVHRAAARP